MAITLHTRSDRTSTPEELIDWVHDNVDPEDESSMLAAAEHLQALSNNRDFIIDKFRTQMQQLAAGTAGNIPSSQTTLYGSVRVKTGVLMIRSVIWTRPFSNNPRMRQLQDPVLSFTTPHDHNFALLTVGYHGPGYRTRIYEYDRSAVAGEIGEQVDLRFLEDTYLEKGKMLYFRTSRDVHSQFHPEEVSISLNLIGEPRDMAARAQFHFDVDKSTICNMLRGSFVTDLMTPFDIVSSLGCDDNLIDLIVHLSRHHQSEHVRKAAYQTVATVRPADFSCIRSSGLSDIHPLVRDTVANLDLAA